MIWVNGLLLALLVLSIVGCALLGPVRLDLSQALRNIFSANPDAEILFRARLPRLLGVAIGGGMAACGVAASAAAQSAGLPADWGFGGASLGGILGLIFFRTGCCPSPAGSSVKSPWVPLAAFFALLSMVLIYRFSLFHGRLHPYHPAVRVIFNAFIAAVIMFS